jgi:hypothetical protein
MLTNIALLVIASPVLLLRGMLRCVHRICFWRIAYSTDLVCRVCEGTVSLVGIWRCTCGFTYRGHVLRACPVCQALPRMVRCFACGTTARLPEP